MTHQYTTYYVLVLALTKLGKIRRRVKLEMMMSQLAII